MTVLAGQVESSSPVPRRLFGLDPIRVIGEGAGSTIYAARDPATGKVYALKHVTRKVEKDVRFVDQLLNEMDISKRVNHPKLRRIFDVKVERTLLRKIISAGLVMELFDGVPLDQQIPPSNVDIVKTFVQVAEALGAMHKCGLVHCDLKPANILRAPDGEARVIDLGQACPVGTKKERIQGTPDYISPEQVKLQAVDERTDIYNFGATLYWCLCGQKLPTLFTLKKDENSFLVDAFIKPPHEINKLVPEALGNFVMECCRVARDKRPQSMAAVIGRLEIILHGMSKV
jgi:eukaryotic-like serine/threonine-protein kinase